MYKRQALYRGKQFDLAKRQVIMALEKAPRYRDAHALLLKIVDRQNAVGGSVPQGSQVSDTQRGISVVAEKESP